MPNPASLESLLNRGLGRLLDRAKTLQRVEQWLKRHLEGPLASHCRVANINGSVLVLQVDSPAWAGRLRYQAPKLMAQLPDWSELRQVERIAVTVRPPELRTPTPVRPVAPLSPKSAAEIEAAAETVTDPQLSAALRRLARNRRS